MVNKPAEDLYNKMQKKGYPEPFCREIAYKYLNTEFTATRMINYLNGPEMPSVEELADEMYAILSDRDRIVHKHLTEKAQGTINEMYRFGL